MTEPDTCRLCTVYNEVIFRLREIATARREMVRLFADGNLTGDVLEVMSNALLTSERELIDALGDEPIKTRARALQLQQDHGHDPAQ